MRRLRSRLPLLRVLLLLAGGCAGLSAARASSTPAAPAPDVSLTYTIVATDRLRIAVFQEPDLSVIARVDAKGLVNLPLTGEVPVAGLTIAEAQRRVEEAYRSGRYLRSPQVTINVEEYAARTISVQGEVRNPGQLTLPIESGMTILDAITRSGGFTDVARGNAVSVTRPLPNGTTRVFTVDVQSYIRGERRARPDETLLLLLPGDVVYVPQRII
jgi:polysaccharide biosynthesis/export protein